MKEKKWYRIYAAYTGMRHRCLNPNNKAYKYYGGRGIKICDRWLDTTPVKTTTNYGIKGSLNFYEDMQATWFPGATVDRIDSNGDYHLDNCRWITGSENARKSCLEQSAKGTNPFQGGDLQRKIQREKVANGTHHFLGPEVNKKRVAEGTNPFVGGKIQSETVRRRIANGDHPFLGGDLQRSIQMKRLANGTHPSQIKIVCPHCDKEIDKGNYGRWHGDRCKTFNSSIVIGA